MILLYFYIIFVLKESFLQQVHLLSFHLKVWHNYNPYLIIFFLKYHLEFLVFDC